MTERQRRRLRLGFLLAIAVGAAQVPFHYLWIDGPTWLRLLLAIGQAYCLTFVIFAFPIVFIMGRMKLRDQREHEINRLGNENVVYSDAEGERKLHEYLTAITSTEARIGLLQRSEPWPGPRKS